MSLDSKSPAEAHGNHDPTLLCAQTEAQKGHANDHQVGLSQRNQVDSEPRSLPRPFEMALLKPLKG